MLSVSLTSGVFAQSGSKNSHGTMTSAMKKKQERQIAKLKSKLVSQIVKTDFSEIKLTKDQRTTLKGLIENRFEKIHQLDNQIAQAVPADKAKSLIRAWKVAMKKGQSNTAAMATSMKSVGMSEELQTKILGFNSSKEELLDEVRYELTETLDDKQKKVLAESAEEKVVAEESTTEKEATE